MEIVIIGSGEIGYHLGKVLSQELHDVTLLDQSIQILRKISEECDVMTVKGNGTSIKDLIRAGVKTADLIVAATDSDEINLVVAMICKRIGNNPRVIARIRNDELFEPESPLTPESLGIDVIIHPEEHVAREIVHLIKRAAASELIAMCEDRLQLVAIRLDAQSPLVGKTIQEYDDSHGSFPMRIVAILRGGITIIPDGSAKITNKDLLFILVHSEDVVSLIQSTGHTNRPIRHVMIAGGSLIAKRVVHLLSKDKNEWQIKLIEPDEEQAWFFANTYKNVLVLQGEPTNPDLLVQEGITETDAFISVTPDEESNIISCLMAKHLGVYKTVALVSKAEYIPLSQTIGLDAAVNKKLSVTNEIHRQIRQGKVISNYAPYGTDAEILELKVSKSSPAAGKSIDSLSLPSRSIIGAVLKNDEVCIATGKTRIESEDHVVVFCYPDVINHITRYFT